MISTFGDISNMFDIGTPLDRPVVAPRAGPAPGSGAAAPARYRQPFLGDIMQILDVNATIAQSYFPIFAGKTNRTEKGGGEGKGCCSLVNHRGAAKPGPRGGWGVKRRLERGAGGHESMRLLRGAEEEGEKRAFSESLDFLGSR